jgi:hypothetical protein
VILLCFPNWKGNCRDDVLVVSDIQRELQVVLDSVKETDFHGALNSGVNSGTT